MAKNTSKQPGAGARGSSDAQDRSGGASSKSTPSKPGSTGTRAGARESTSDDTRGRREDAKSSSSTAGSRTSGREGNGMRDSAGRGPGSSSKTGSQSGKSATSTASPRGRGQAQEAEPRGPLPQGKGAKDSRPSGTSTTSKSATGKATGPGLTEQVVDFLCCGLETEQGGILVYNAAIECAQNDELREEWEKYAEETEEHVQLYTEILEELGIDPNLQTPGRPICRNTAQALIKNMQMARKSGDPKAAEIVAAECVVIAESKCHLNWELVGELGKKMKSDEGKRLKAAYEEVHEQEKEHLYHTQGWARELWISRLGMPAVIPPPEEEKDVKTRIGAEKAKNARKEML